MAGVAGGWLVTKITNDKPLDVFWASAALTAGLAVFLVGLVLRFQLDIQDELDEARQAREQFQSEMREQVAVIDRRVQQALLELDDRRETTRLTRASELAGQLESARARVRQLEAKLAAERQPKKRSFRSLLAPDGEHARASAARRPGSPNRIAVALSARLKSLVMGAWRAAVAAVLICVLCAAGFAVAAGIGWLVYHFVPASHHVIYSEGLLRAPRYYVEAAIASLGCLFAAIAEGRWRRIGWLLAIVLYMNVLAIVSADLHHHASHPQAARSTPPAVRPTPSVSSRSR